MAGSSKYRRVENAASKAAKLVLTARQKAAISAAQPQDRAALRQRFNDQLTLSKGQVIVNAEQAPRRPRTARKPAPRRPAAARPARAVGRPQRRSSERAVTAAERASIKYKLNYARTNFSPALPVPLPTTTTGPAAPSLPVSGALAPTIFTVAAGATVALLVMPYEAHYPVRTFVASDHVNSSVSFFTYDGAAQDIESIATANSFFPATGEKIDFRKGSHPAAGFGDEPVVGVYGGGSGIAADTDKALYYDNTAEPPALQLLSGYVDITCSATQTAQGSLRIVDIAGDAFDHKGKSRVIGEVGMVQNRFIAPLPRHQTEQVNTLTTYAAKAGELSDFCGGGDGARITRRLYVTPGAGYAKLGCPLMSLTADGGDVAYKLGHMPRNVQAVIANGYALITNTGSTNTQITVSGAFMYSVLEPEGLQTNLSDMMRKIMSPVCQTFAHESVTAFTRAPLAAHHGATTAGVIHDYHHDHAIPAANDIRAAEKAGGDFLDDLFSGKVLKSAVDGARAIGDIALAAKDLL